MGESRYIQTNAAFLTAISAEQRKRMAMLYYLYCRFPNKIIYRGLSDETCRKAGLDRRTLKKYISALMETGDGPGVLAKWSKEGHVFLITDRFLRKNTYRNVLGRRPTSARCTLVLDTGMSVREIIKSIEQKVFEHLAEQVLVGKQRKHDSGSGYQVGEGGSELQTVKGDGPLSRMTHPKSLELPTTKYQAPMPSAAFSKRMGVSQRTFWRRVSEWESRGAIRRNVRRIELEEPGFHPKGWCRMFHERYGIHPFRCGGLWYGQLSNTYELTHDYRGPNAWTRREVGGYGKTTEHIISCNA